jgi:lipoprotein-anchoring transpeptidase ErfK/SrfK
MTINRKTLIGLLALASAIPAGKASAQIDLPPNAPTAGKEDVDNRNAYQEPLLVTADLSKRRLTVLQGDKVLKTYQVSVGQPRYPTPTGTYTIKKIIWNPSWHPPPNSAWARGKSAKGPGEPGNPMKVVKIFFREPDYYIHGTGDLESLGEAESHGCLRMDPDQVADLAKLIMEHGGQPRDENWFWRIIHSRREQKVVYLDNPVSMTVTD